MQGYSQFADLEALLYAIPDETVRAYARESIASYSSGAYRSAIVSIWIAVVLDLYQKFQVLSEQFNDNAAKRCIEDIERIRNSPDKKRVSTWERDILDKAFNDVQLLNSTEYDHLQRIQQDRHRCAHPVLDAEGFLFQPSPELVRSHIRTAIESVLSQPPILGKAAGEAFERDIEGTYFPDDDEGIKNALLKKHISAGSDKYRANLFKLTLKKILFLDLTKPEYVWRYIGVFKCLISEDRHTFEKIDSQVLEAILDKTEDGKFLYLRDLFDIEETLFYQSSGSLRGRFKDFLVKTKKPIEKWKSIHLFPEFREDFLGSYQNLDSNIKRRVLETLIESGVIGKDSQLTEFIVKTNIDIFSRSSSFAEGRGNAYHFLIPIIPLLKSDDIQYLLKQAVECQRTYRINQLQDCSEHMEKVFRETIRKYPNTISDWRIFYESIKDSWGSTEELGDLITKEEHYNL